MSSTPDYKCLFATGGHVERDQHRSPYPHQLYRSYAVSVQEGSGLVPEDPLTSHFSVGAAQQPAGRTTVHLLLFQLILVCVCVCSLFIFRVQVSNEPGNRYNIQLINALVLYVGTQAIAHIHNKGSTPSMSTITHSAHMDIFQNLAVDLDTEGKKAI